jgi:hypothetical protein
MRLSVRLALLGLLAGCGKFHDGFLGSNADAGMITDGGPHARDAAADTGLEDEDDDDDFFR